MSFASGGAPDPYRVSGDVAPFDRDYTNIDGLTQVAGTLTSGESTAVLLMLGQSLGGCNTSYGAYSPVNSKNHFLNIYNGGVYQWINGPVPGTDNTRYCLLARIGDKLITAGTYTRVIGIPIGKSGSAAADWAAGGSFNHRITVAVKRAQSLGLTITKVLWDQGVADALGSTTQVAYQNSLTSIKETARAAGCNAPILVALQGWGSGGLGSNSTNVRAAQAAVVDGVDFFAGPDTDTINNASRQDGTHYNATGANTAAGLWFDKI